MKVLVVNGNYKIGSTGKVMFSLYRALQERGFSVSFYYGIESGEITDQNVFDRQPEYERLFHSFFGKVTGFQGCFSNGSTKNLINKLKKNMPDIVFFGVLHGNYLNMFKLLKFLKENNVLCIQLMFDEYMMTGKCAYSYECEKYMTTCSQCERIQEYPVSWMFDTSKVLHRMKAKLYEGFDQLKFVVIPYTAVKARKSSLLKGKDIFELDEAIDTEHLYFPRDATLLRNSLNIPKNHKIVLGVCLFSSKRKGGKYLLEIARLFRNEDTTFIHIGVDEKIENVPDNFIAIPYENDQAKMSEYYSLADVFVCTSIADTYPHTCLEALSCGTKIIGFDVSAIPSCAEQPFGEYVECFNIRDMAESIKRCNKKTTECSEKTSEYARKRFSNRTYNKSIIDFALNCLKESNENEKSAVNTK